MLIDYMRLGGVEIVNNALVWGLSRAGDCPVASWLRQEPCPWFFVPGEARRTNRATVPQPATAWTASWGTGGGGVASNVTDGGVPARQMEWTTAPSGGAARMRVGGSVAAVIAWSPGQVLPIQALVSHSRLTQIQLAVDFYNGGSWISYPTSPLLPVGPGLTQVAWTPPAAPAGTTHGNVYVIIPAATPAQVGDVLRVAQPMVDAVGPYFDGDTPDDEYVYGWSGDPNASISTERFRVAPEDVTQAPWYDPNEEATTRFYGVYGISAENLVDSTQVGTYQEGISDGGTLDLVRRAVREVRVKALLLADGADALEAGLSWLDAALRQRGSGVNASCQTTDLMFYTTCPSEVDGDQVWRLERYLHNSSKISGPLVLETLVRDRGRGYLVEFTIGSMSPALHGATRPLGFTTSGAIPVIDTPTNLVATPSAEIAGPQVEVMRNWSANPSVEVDATGWSGTVVTVSGTAPGARFASQRTLEWAVVGSASYRGAIVGNATAATGRAGMRVSNVVALGALAAGARVSVSVYGSAQIHAAPDVTTVHALRAWVAWSGGTARTDPLGVDETVEWGGVAFSEERIAPPAGTTTATVTVEAEVSWSSGAVGVRSDVRVYADAVAVTIP